MNDIEGRLETCFANVFPDLPAADIPTAHPESVAGWDSVATVTLFAVIEEEFNTEIGIEDLKSDQSFQGILNCLKGKLEG